MDMSESRVHTALAGGASDRRFSKYYANELARWQNYEYKVLDADSWKLGPAAATRHGEAGELQRPAESRRG